METAEVVVIGGGLIGTSIAFQLAKHLQKVVLLEAGEIGGKTSGSCDKAIFLQSKKPGFPIQLAKASRAMYDTLEEELGMPFEYKRSGGMIVIEKESHIPFMKQFVKNQSDAGIEVTLLDKQTAREMQPNFSEHIVGSTYSAEDAEVNPLLLSQAFAYGGKQLGVDIRTHTKVTHIKTVKNKVTSIVTNKGEISTELVINATGPFAPKIAKMVGVDLPIKPRRGVILITEQSQPFVRGSVLCSQYIASKHLTKNGDEPAPPYGIGLSLGQTESGNILIGGSREFVGFNKQVDASIISAIATHATRIAPELANIRLIRTMTGFRPFTGDGLPIIDMSQEVAGYITAAGHEGDGIALAPITGQLVADLVIGDDQRKDLLKPLQLERFKDMCIN